MGPIDWRTLRDRDSERVEEELRAAGFAQVDAYRFNKASIRVRVVDPRFAGMPFTGREGLVNPALEGLPRRIFRDLLMVLMVSPDRDDPRQVPLEAEFEAPWRRP